MPESDEYHRGHAAGGIEERLDSHDKHFAAINGSLTKIAEALHQQTLAIQRLADQAVSDAGTRVATARALKEADEARRDSADQSWTPKAKLITVVVAVAAVAAVVVGVVWR